MEVCVVGPEKKFLRESYHELQTETDFNIWKHDFAR